MLPRRVVALASLLVLGLTVSACGSAEDTPPVAAVAVDVDHPRTPIGAPVVFTYHFTPRAAIDGDYLVFAHLVNVDGQVLWNDDHPPAVATSAWQTGETVTYAREVFLPAGQVRPGEVTLEVGLYRGGERLPLEGPRPPANPAARAYPVVDLQLLPEAENVFLVFQDGWHPDEFETGDSGRSWKWTQRSAAIAFRHPKRDAVLLLEYDGRPDVFGSTPQQLRVLGADNREVASFIVDSPERVLRRVPLTSADMGERDMGELRLEVDRTFVPAEQGIGSTDRRELGVRVLNVFLDAR